MIWFLKYFQKVDMEKKKNTWVNIALRSLNFKNQNPKIKLINTISTHGFFLFLYLLFTNVLKTNQVLKAKNIFLKIAFYLFYFIFRF